MVRIELELSDLLNNMTCNEVIELATEIFEHIYEEDQDHAANIIIALIKKHNIKF